MARKDEQQAEVTPEQPDWQQMFLEQQEQIKALWERIATPAPAQEGQWVQALLERMLAIQEQQAKALEEQSARTLPKENPNYVVRSFFLKENGEPWAAGLKCDIYLNSIHLNKTPLLQREVEALNALEPVQDVLIRKVDGSHALGSVTPRKDAMGRLDRLTMTLPMKKDDNPQHYPALDEIALQFATHTAQLTSV